MSKIFKALSDPTRRAVLQHLQRGPMGAGELAALFDVSKPTMSAHFAVLVEADLIEADKHGRTITYHLRMSVLEDAWYGVFDEDPGFTGEREYCYDFGFDEMRVGDMRVGDMRAEEMDDDPSLGLRVLPAGSYACLDFHDEWPRFRSMYEDWLDKQAVWRLDSTRPHIQRVARDGKKRWQGWLALPVKKR